MGEQHFKVRASSWGKLFDCAYKWEGEHILGMKKPSGGRALLGTAIHAGTAVFDLARIENTTITTDDAAGVMVKSLQNPEFEVDWSIDDLKPKDAEIIGLSLITEYCMNVSPRYEFSSVEMETKPFPIDCGNGVIITLTGTLDRSRVRKSSGGKGISDVKTGGAAVQKGEAKTKGHAPQIGTYELLFEHTTGEKITEPAEIIGLKTKGKAESGIGQIVGARDIMVGTENYRGLIDFAAEMFRTGLFPPNPSSHLCNEKYCARWSTCPYHN